MLKSKNKLFKIARPFLSCYVFSVFIILSGGYIVKIQREIEEYKQIDLWYENMEVKTKYTNNILNFLKDVKTKLKRDAEDLTKTESKKLNERIKEKIRSDDNFPDEGSVHQWKIGKTGEEVKVNYAYTAFFNRL
ncbi:hypothetical protein [Nostoc sp.]|uniref:hypothetical protein n=1 Tax=Nostoc sp. TaxID=1180 RepID=UPI002FF57A9B